MPKRLRKGTALALSGGGFRATLFHAGALLRLAEFGVLRRITRFVGVSGGAIALGALASAWTRIRWDGDVATNLEETVVGPLSRFCQRNVDLSSIASGIIRPGKSIAETVRSKYRRFLVGDTKLCDLPSAPQFIFQSTNLATGRSFRFNRDYVADYLIGSAPSGEITLATAIAASAAFPPLLSPVSLKIAASQFRKLRGARLFDDERYRKRLMLTDGGVYDNLGLESAWDNEEVIVSDAGAPFEFEAETDLSWLAQTTRAFAIATDQTRGLRKRWLVGEFVSGVRRGTYWGINTNIEHYEKHEVLVSPDVQQQLSNLATRLAPLSAKEHGRLLNLGYALADAACRTHLSDLIDTPLRLPRPEFPLT